MINKMLIITLSFLALGAHAAGKKPVIAKLCKSGEKDLFWTYQIGDEQPYEISMIGVGTESAILPFRGYENHRRVYMNDNLKVSVASSSKNVLIDDSVVVDTYKMKCETVGE